METNQPKKYTAKQRFFAIAGGTILMIIIAIANKSGSGSDSKGNGDCNCQYQDELGNKKRVKAMDYRECVDLYRGKYLGTSAGCDVPKYTTF